MLPRPNFDHVASWPLQAREHDAIMQCMETTNTAGNTELLAELSAAAKAGRPGLETHPDYIAPDRFIVTRRRIGDAAPSLSLHFYAPDAASALDAYFYRYPEGRRGCVYTVRPYGTPRHDAQVFYGADL